MRMSIVLRIKYAHNFRIEDRKPTGSRITGESRRKDGLYQFQYTDAAGKRHCVYALNLIDLREKEKDILRDSEDGIRSMGTKIVMLLYPEQVECSMIHQIFCYFQSALGELNPSSSFSAAIMCHPDDRAKISSPKAGSENTESLLQEISFSLLYGNWQNYFDVLEQLRNICISEQSMHALFCIRIYQTIALYLLNYIDSHRIQAEVSTQAAIYPLYYINNFPGWSQAFDYLPKSTPECLLPITGEIRSSYKGRADAAKRLPQRMLQRSCHVVAASDISPRCAFSFLLQIRVFM